MYVLYICLFKRKVLLGSREPISGIGKSHYLLFIAKRRKHIQIPPRCMKSHCHISLYMRASDITVSDKHTATFSFKNHTGMTSNSLQHFQVKQSSRFTVCFSQWFPVVLKWETFQYRNVLSLFSLYFLSINLRTLRKSCWWQTNSSKSRWIISKWKKTLTSGMAIFSENTALLSAYL